MRVCPRGALHRLRSVWSRPPADHRRRWGARPRSTATGPTRASACDARIRPFPDALALTAADAFAVPYARPRRLPRRAPAAAATLPAATPSRPAAAPTGTPATPFIDYPTVPCGAETYRTQCFAAGTTGREVRSARAAPSAPRGPGASSPPRATAASPCFGSTARRPCAPAAPCANPPTCPTSGRASEPPRGPPGRCSPSGAARARGLEAARRRPRRRPCVTDHDCDDGRYCTGAERCLEGRCAPGDPVVCLTGGDPCNDSLCDDTRPRQRVFVTDDRVKRRPRRRRVFRARSGSPTAAATTATTQPRGASRCHRGVQRPRRRLQRGHRRRRDPLSRRDFGAGERRGHAPSAARRPGLDGRCATRRAAGPTRGARRGCISPRSTATARRARPSPRSLLPADAFGAALAWTGNGRWAPCGKTDATPARATRCTSTASTRRARASAPTSG